MPAPKRPQRGRTPRSTARADGKKPFRAGKPDNAKRGRSSDTSRSSRSSSSGRSAGSSRSSRDSDKSFKRGDKKPSFRKDKPTGSREGPKKSFGNGRGKTTDRPERSSSRGAPRARPERDTKPARAAGPFGPYVRRRRHGIVEKPERLSESEPQKTAKSKAPLRVTQSPKKRTRKPVAPKSRGIQRRTRQPNSGVQEEIIKIVPQKSNKLLGMINAATEAYKEERNQDVVRILQPLKSELGNAPTVRELLGLAKYRLGQYGIAIEELEAYTKLSGDVDQFPALMDCYRAQKRWNKVDQLWEELRTASPSAGIVAEGRIVMAGARADRGQFKEAIELLDKKAGNVKQPSDYQMRTWYALADLYERAGELGRARDLFQRIAKQDPNFFDSAERLASL